MDLSLTPGQETVRDAARQYAADVLAPKAVQLDVEGGFPLDNIRAAAKAGMTAINVEAALGGRAAGTIAYSLAVTEMARVCAGTTVALCVNNMVAEVVAHFGDEAQRASHVPRLADGRHVVGAFALSEPGAGSDPGAMRTRAIKTDRGWVINGEKLWITSGTDAGLFIVWAKTNDSPGPRGISTFLVPGDTPGLSRGKPEHKMGLHGSTTTALQFTDCEVPHSALLGVEGKGFGVAMMALDGGRIGIASQALGIGLAAVDTAVQWVRDNVAAAQEQAVLWALADSATELDAARLLTLRAAGLKERGASFSQEASHAKVYATERAWKACNRVLDVMGEAGLDRAAGVERNLRDVRVTMIYEGTSEVQRIVISRNIMRRFGGS
ncbi:MAG: acyl-CoA dehydrogenase family protein [Nannocystaceae bacterium]|nr:acyl-CoA dehydrogenase family protein [Nannocystaceae bacterium]